MHETRVPSRRTTLTTVLTYIAIGLWGAAGAVTAITWNNLALSSVVVLSAAAAALSLVALHRQIADLRLASHAIVEQVVSADMQAEVNGVRLLKILATLEAAQEPDDTIVDLASHADRRSRGA